MNAGSSFFVTSVKWFKWQWGHCVGNATTPRNGIVLRVEGLEQTLNDIPGTENTMSPVA